MLFENVRRRRRPPARRRAAAVGFADAAVRAPPAANARGCPGSACRRRGSAAAGRRNGARRAREACAAATERLVNLKRIPALQGIDWSSETGLRIGALTTIREVEQHQAVRTWFPALAEACHVVANVRIRNLATLGGNLAHADYQSDPPAMLIALGARVRISFGER
ncbi:MAG: FAD binding domain-containing protein [Acidimicrobiia bacterium]|nr:FAD binding domain-containing protein [Acidimicrobiia bacterium]